ncbi:uncharacterized protein PHALS_00695 [Plasmopara halstedii]|uniref:Uncharacterized protein n=1 Tax=Plasmopara halstedii TaxID=4781 RepID=A0A0P1AT36_PLAHL|nr:uncharacterized protein PHALS_00695 [Plasmopara halstedii]CEG44326.1 hypothetical protein PHALS_00695 [Plasmopara halstedii]|eukprot:XP_024580695.1 hypothetical protein PHALS_00695 [Plasmopara halstedii]
MRVFSMVHPACRMRSNDCLSVKKKRFHRSRLKGLLYRESLLNNEMWALIQRPGMRSFSHSQEKGKDNLDAKQFCNIHEFYICGGSQRYTLRATLFFSRDLTCRDPAKG